MKKQVLFGVLAALLLLQVPSHDQDLWTASLIKAKSIAAHSRAELFRAARRGDPRRRLDQGHPRHPRPPLLFPRSLELLADARGLHGQVLRHGHADPEAGRQHRRYRAHRGRAGPSPGHPAGRHHLPHRRRIDGPALELRRHAEAPGDRKGIEGHRHLRPRGRQALRSDHRPRGDPPPERPVRLPPPGRHRLHLRPELRRGDARASSRTPWPSSPARA